MTGNRLEGPFIDWSTGTLTGKDVCESVRTLEQMHGLYHNRAAWDAMDLNTVVYRVRWWAPVADGTEGGLLFGTTVIEPGQVGDEYFMTYGHRHVNRSRAEYYSCVQGMGMLLMVDDARRTAVEEMAPGTVHYIFGNMTHRVTNTGPSPLRFVACWHADAGHDYEVIRGEGFPSRVLSRNGVPTVVKAE